MIFQASLDQGIVPDVCKLASVVPVYKKGAGKILVTTCQYLLHVFVPRFWSTLSILVSLIIWNIIKFHVTNNMAFNSIEAAKHS